VRAATAAMSSRSAQVSASPWCMVPVAANAKEPLCLLVVRSELRVRDRPRGGQFASAGIGMLIARYEVDGVEPLQRHPVERAGATRSASDEGHEPTAPVIGDVEPWVPATAGGCQSLEEIAGRALGERRLLGIGAEQGGLMRETGASLFAEEHAHSLLREGQPHRCSPHA